MSKMRLTVSGLVAMVVTSSLFAQPPETVQLNISSQPLNKALNAWADATGYQVMISEERAARGRTAPTVRGVYTPEGALRILLASSDLNYRFVGERTVAIRTAEADAATPDSHPKQADHDLNAEEHQRPLALAQSRPRETEEAATLQRTDRTEGTTNGKKGIEEVVVTAQKREERLIETPQSVSVVSAETIAKLGAAQFRDFANTVPGLNFATAGAGQTQVSLRGLNTGFDIGSTIGVYVDDVPFGTSGAFAQGAQNTIDVGLFDIDRIEVLRGPQGTLYGASTMGGLIKYVTARPSTTDFRVSSQAGAATTADDGGVSYNVAAAVNVPIAQGTAGLRATGYQTHDGGFVDNVALGKKNVDRSDIYGGRVDFLLTPTEELSVQIDAFLQNISRDGQSTVDYSRSGTPTYGTVDQYRKVEEPWEQRFRLISGTVRYDFGPASLTSITSYQEVRNHYVFDISPLYVPFFPTLYSAIGYPVNTGTDKVTEELRLASRPSNRLEWLVGGFYNHESTTNEQKLQPYTLSGQASSDNLFTFSNPSTYTEYSAFGDVTWHFTDQFDVTGGLRYSHDRQTKIQIGSGAFGSSQPETASTESVVTYLGNARYRFADNKVGYLRFATGYRPGGPNFVSLNPITQEPNGPPTFESDHLRSYEAGFKAESDDRRFGADVAVYYIDWTNIQVSISTGNGFTGIGNAPGGATVNGAELTLTARPVEHLALSGAFAYQHAYLKEADASLGASKGESLPNVPRFSGSVNADYTFLESGIQPTIGATVRYVDDRRASFDQSTFPQYHLPAYTTADVRAGMTFGSVVTQLYVHNLFNERGQLGVLFPQFGNYVAILQPRTVGVTATAHF